MVRKGAPDFSESLQQLTAALRRTSHRPSIVGYKPQDHQIAFHSSTAKGRLFIGGNRSGKTVGGGAETVMWLSGKHLYHQKFPTPVKGRAVGVDFDQGVKKIMMPEVARWVPPSLLKNGSWEDSYSKGEKVLTLTNGSTLEFMSYDQDVDKFAGTSRHFTWFDEEPPEEIFNECLMRLVDTGGNWWVTMTPLVDMSWTYDRLYLNGKSGRDPNIEVFEVMTSMNEYVSMAELEILTMGQSEEEKRARTLGTYINLSGTIYGKAINPKVTYIPSIVDSDNWPFIYSKWGHFGMLDHGYTNPTAFYLGAFDEEGRIIIYDEYYEKGRLIKENSEAIIKRLTELRLLDRLHYIVADPSIRNRNPISGTSLQQEYAENGLNLSLGNNDVTAGILRVAGRFQNRKLFITNNCEKLQWELARYRWDKYTSKSANRRNLKETPVKKDDHAVDALRYGVVSRPALDGEVDMQVGNVLNTAVSREAWDTDSELELLSLAYGEVSEQYDSMIGEF